MRNQTNSCCVKFSRLKMPKTPRICPRNFSGSPAKARISSLLVHSGLRIHSLSGVMLAIRIANITPESEWIRRPEWTRSEEIRAFAGEPLKFRGQILGVLGIFSRENLTQQEFVWLRMFADQAAVAITNAQAFERAGQAL